MTCTYTNTQEGSITIVKDTVPDGPQDFTFNPSANLNSDANFLLDDDADGTLQNSRTFSDLEPGTYEVTEGAEAEFDLTALTCSDSSGTSLQTRTATIELAAGESVTCTFTNTAKPATIAITKTADDATGVGGRPDRLHGHGRPTTAPVPLRARR